MMWPDYEGIELLAYRLRVERAENLALDSRSHALLESVVHEVAHARSLGVPVEQGVTYAIHDALRPQGVTALVRNEALTLASEQHALRALGVAYVEFDDFADEAKRQGVKRDAFNRVWGSKEALDLGQRVTRFIGRRLGRGRSLRHL